MKIKLDENMPEIRKGPACYNTSVLFLFCIHGATVSHPFAVWPLVSEALSVSRDTSCSLIRADGFAFIMW